MGYEQTEDEKYSWLYTHGYDVGPVRMVYEWAASVAGSSWPPQKVVDLGCGRASLWKYGWKDYTGIDIASAIVRRNAKKIPSVKFVHGSITKTPFEDGEFDMAFCVDVLEHLPEEAARLAVAEARRIARSGFFSISTRPSKCRSKEGEQLHLTIRQPSWWEQLFVEAEWRIEERQSGSDYILLWVIRSGGFRPL